MADKIKLRRGTNAQRASVVFDAGEPVFTTDTYELYLGDGVTLGGKKVTGKHESDYDHASFATHVADTTGNPHNLDYTDVGADAAGSAATVQGNLTTHTNNTSNPHSVTVAQIGAIPTSEKGAASGVAPLNADSKIDVGYLPSIAITDVFVAADITARDALTVQEGDVAIVTDAGAGESNSYIYDGTSWQELLKPADAVSSVNGQTGAVILNDGSIAYTRSDASKHFIAAGSDTIGAAINDLDDALYTHTQNTTDAHGINTKADKVGSAVAGNIATLDAAGNLVDSGYAPADFDASGAVTTHETTYDHASYDSHLVNTSNPHGVTLVQLGAAAEVHTHTAAQVTDFNTAADARIANLKDVANGWKSIGGDGIFVLDGGSIA